jgi:hypothetical protein
VGTWDLWHLTGGMSFTVKDMDFTAGIEYAWGSDSRDDYRAYIDENGEVSGEYTNVEISYKRLKGLIGFNVDFGQSSE